MVGIWLDNKNYTPAPDPFVTSANIVGDASYISGYGILASYHPYTVVNSGAVNSPTVGIGLQAGGAVTNQSGGNIFGTADGVNVQGGGGVTNLSGGTISGGGRAVLILSGGGTIQNQTSASIIGGFEGVDLETSGGVTNAGTIIGNYGIVARSGGQVSIAATGTVSAASDGVFLGQFNYSPPIYGGATNGTVINQGRITASGSGSLANGIVMNVAIAYVNNSGTIIGQDSTGTIGLGIAFNYGGTLRNTGRIYGGLAGLSAGGNPVTKGAEGVVNDGTILGATYGVRLFAGGLIQNNLRIGARANGGIGIKLANGGTVDNAGYLYGEANGLYATKAASVTNEGMIRATTDGGQAIRVKGGGSVTNAAGATIAGYASAIDIQGGVSAVVVNSGSIDATGTGNLGAVELNSGPADQLTNRTGGIITGSQFGAELNLGGTLVNYGSISARPFNAFTQGVAISVIGYLMNAPGATISGNRVGVSVANGISGPAAITVTNSGTIRATGASSGGLVLDNNAGPMTNNAGGYIGGVQYGLISQSTIATTFVNAGTISGGVFAVKMPAKYANLLRVAPGAVFSGTIDLGNPVGATVGSVLELMASARGSLSGLGSTVVNFATVIFDPGANWTVAGNSGGIAGGQTFSGFAVGDALDLTGISGEIVTGFAANTLSLGGDAALTVIIPGGFTQDSFVLKDDLNNGTLIELACFASGTRIRSVAGDVTVESLRVGDRVVTRDGTARPIVWTGRRHVDCRRHKAPETVLPVRIRAGTFGPGAPSRDLWLSPDHALFVAGVLIPVRYLIDGDAIRQENVASVVYHHIELADHDIILAEGLTVESYLDTGGRSAFTGHGNPVSLHPNFAARMWEAAGCARLVVTGPELDAARAMVQRGSPARAAA